MCYIAGNFAEVALRIGGTAMDDLDHKLLSLLRRDARTSVADLASALGVSRGTVTNRMRRLEERKVIQGYTVKIRPGSEPQGVRAWMGIQVEGSQRTVVTALLGDPGVQALHDTNGRWDLLAEINAASMAELSQILERIRTIKGVQATETSIHLATFR